MWLANCYFAHDSSGFPFPARSFTIEQCCAKIPRSGFQRNVTLLHSELLLSAALVSVPRYTRPIDSMLLLPAARATVPKRVHPYKDVRPVGVLEFIRMEKSDQGERICTIERLALHHEVFRSFACCKLSVLKELVGASGFEPPSSWSRIRLDQTKSVELTAFNCAIPLLIWATWLQNIISIALDKGIRLGSQVLDVFLWFVRVEPLVWCRVHETTCFASTSPRSNDSFLCSSFLMIPTISGNLLLARSKLRSRN